MTHAVLLLSVLEVLGLILIAGLTYQLLQQQGRILVHIESLEELIPEMGSAPAAVDGRARGIPPAMPIPEFSLPDPSGTLIGPQNFEGRRFLLVNWDPSCGFCDQIVEDLGKLQPDLNKRRTDVVLVSRGTAEKNRSFIEGRGLDCLILLRPDGTEHIAAFARTGTPAAYLVDEHGRVAKPMALGADEVLEVARSAAGRSIKLHNIRPLSESRIERNGLPAGTPAPPFELPTITGEKASLDGFRGSRFLLVLTDPDCEPCEVLARELALWHRDHRDNGLAMLMISRGDLDENRKKVEHYGIEFPVALQPRWRISKVYGTFAMPSAFLIDDRGVIEKPVARGPEEIMALAREAVATKPEVGAG